MFWKTATKILCNWNYCLHGNWLRGLWVREARRWRSCIVLSYCCSAFSIFLKNEASEWILGFRLQLSNWLLWNWLGCCSVLVMAWGGKGCQRAKLRGCDQWPVCPSQRSFINMGHISVRGAFLSPWMILMKKILILILKIWVTQVCTQ